MTALPPDGVVTLADAREWLLLRVDDGAPCPCCTQLAKVYRRKINAGMAHSLITMYQAARTDWCHVPTVVGARSREEGKLAYWGLVEEELQRRPDGGRAGWWRVTGRGADYVLDRLRVPKYARVYDGRVLGHTGELLGVRDALGTRFDYNDLMGGV